MYANDKQILLIIVFFPYTCNDIRSAQSTMHPGPGLLIPSCFTDAGETGEDIIITRGEDTHHTAIFHSLLCFRFKP